MDYYSDDDNLVPLKKWNVVLKKICLNEKHGYKFVQKHTENKAKREKIEEKQQNEQKEFRTKVFSFLFFLFV